MSFGAMSMTVTVTPLLEVEYVQTECADHDELAWLSGGYDADADAFDVLAAVASLDAGYDLSLIHISEPTRPY